MPNLILCTESAEWLNPIRDGEEAFKIIFHNSFITNHALCDENVVEIVKAVRSRYKVKNENNNTLKRNGYNLEHNYGHGQKNLSMLLATFNMLAFLFHTMLDFGDALYQVARKAVGPEGNFFKSLEF